MQKLDVVVTLVAPVLSVWLTTLLVRRRLYRDFPFFLTYIISSILITGTRLWVIGNYQAFFIVAWTTEAIYAVLALLALHEVFRRVFMAFFQRWWFWLFFPLIVATIFTLTVVYHMGNPPAQANRVVSLILSLGTAVNLVQALVFLLFFALVTYHGIRWRNYPVGIVLGFAAISVGAFAANWTRSEFGTRFNIFAGYAYSVVNILALILWLVTFLQPPEAEPRWIHEITPGQLLGQIQQYIQILERYWKRRK
jgi:hypothetical protein